MSFKKDKKKEIESLFQIIKIHVEEKFDVEIFDFEFIKLKTRKEEFVYARKLMMVILGENFLKDYTQQDISEIFNLDRTSFIHHSKIHLQDYTTYDAYKIEYDKLRLAFEKVLEKSY